MKFIFKQAEDCSVDSEHVLAHDDGTETNIAIQDGRSYSQGYNVNRYGPNCESVEFLHTGVRSLKKAKELALKAFVQ